MSDLQAIREDIVMAERSPEMAKHVALDHAPELVDEVEKLRAEVKRLTNGAKMWEKVATKAIADLDAADERAGHPRHYKLWEIELLHDAGQEFACVPEVRNLRADVERLSRNADVVDELTDILHVGSDDIVDAVQRLRERLANGPCLHRHTNDPMTPNEALAWRQNERLLARVERLAPREITTDAEVSMLPPGTILRDASGHAWYRGEGSWVGCGGGPAYDPVFSPGNLPFPATVLYLPEGGE